MNGNPIPRARRRLRIVAALSICLAGSAIGSASAQDAEPYRLSPGDVVAITVYGRAELSGQFSVSPDGSLAYPLLGNVVAAGLTPPELGGRIDEGLGEHVPGVSVTASIAQYAPVFIVGEVQTPGQYAFRPGMTTLELLALGGGLRRAADMPEATELQMIAARQDYADLELQMLGQMAARERLQAELDGKPYEPEPEATDPDPVWQALRKRVIDGERRLYAIRKAALESADSAFLAQQRSYGEEIKKVAASIELHKQEIGLLQEDVAAQRSLAERGLTARSNLRETERILSATRRDALELDSFLARAQQNKLAIEQERVALVTSRRDEVARQIQEADLNLARMRARQRSLQQTMAELALMAGSGALEAAEQQVTYTILRSEEGSHREIGAAELDALRPGDIVRVAVPALLVPSRVSLN